MAQLFTVMCAEAEASCHLKGDARARENVVQCRWFAFRAGVAI